VVRVHRDPRPLPGYHLGGVVSRERPRCQMKALFLGGSPRRSRRASSPTRATLRASRRCWPMPHRCRPHLAQRVPSGTRLRRLQSVAAGLDLLDLDAMPKGVTVCNVFGHEPAIAEHVIMTMLVLTHCLFAAVTA
jgi:hypothetical protein